MKKLIILSAFFLSSCISTSIPEQLQPSLDNASIRVLETPRATQGATVTPTLDYASTIAAANNDAYLAQQNSMVAQQAAINAQETSQAAQVAIVAFTAQAEQIQLEYIRLTQVADNATAVMQATNIGMTQQAEQATQTYQPTADAINSTQQAIVVANNTLQSGLMTQVAAEPARIREVETARDIAQYGWMTYMAQVFAGLAVLAIGIGFAVFLFNWSARQVVTVPDELPEIIPLNIDRSNGGWTATRADVPVTFDVLASFAEGIIRLDKTPAFDVWQGVISRADLTQIRGFLLRENMAQHVKAGEITIIQTGRDFLTRVCETGECPLPYRTISPKSDYIPAVRTSNVATEAVGEVL